MKQKKNFILTILAFFLVMVPVGVVAEESVESADQNTEVSETADDEDNLEDSASKDNNPEQKEEKTKIDSESADSDVETIESSEVENDSTSNDNESSNSEEEVEQLDSGENEEEPTYEAPSESTENAEYEVDETKTDSEKNSSNTKDQLEDNINDEPIDEEIDKAKNLQMNSISVQSTSTGLPYKLGDRAEEISEIKKKLNSIGFSGILVTDFFGEFTEKRVIEFQEYYDLLSTGEVNQDTLDKLNTVYGSPHQLGKTHPSNSDIKEKLNTVGYGGILVTDYFGDFTEKRVIEFQKDHDLKAHGIVDSKTMTKLNEIYNSAIRPGQSDPILIDVKEKLNSLGFGGIIVTELYGSFTEKRVREFQSYAGLPSTGLIDEKTLDELNSLAANGYSVGDSHSKIADMKRKLNRLNFSGIIVDNYFGSYTEKRLKQFQKYYGIPETGGANKETLDLLDKVYNSPLQVGKSHSDLKEVKEQLNAIGYSGIIVTSYFGDFTEKRVKEFQRDYGLKSHGIVDSLTLTKINEIYNSAIKSGESDPILLDVKEKLNSLGFGGIIVTEYYGDFTEKRVKEFQRYAGISVTGLLDEQTLTELDNLAVNGYGVGDSQSMISSMKRKLNSLGFSGILITDYYGNFTEKRIKEFQKYFGIPVTGRANKRTLDELDAIYNHPLQVGKSHSDLIEIKEMLNAIGYGGIIVTNYFGDFTEKRIKQFQRDYGLKSHGRVDQKTREKIEEIYYSAAIWPGESNPVLIKVKENLNSLGFGGIIVTEYYGDFTEKRVKEFQSFAGLPTTGAIGERTITALNKLARDGYKVSDSHSNITTIKEKLNRVGFNGIIVDNYFGNFTEKRVKEFQDYYNISVTGRANKETLDQLNYVFNHPYQLGKRHNDISEIKIMLNKIGYGGITVTNYFGDFTEKRVKEFQKDEKLPVSGIVEDNTLNRLNQIYEETAHKEVNYSYTFDYMVDLQMKYGSPKYDGAGNIAADEANVRYYLNPANFPEGTPAYLQFLLLDESANVTAKELNENYLEGKGMLANTGAAFIRAGELYGLNEFYLMAHALHETGNGGSTLALGVGVDRNGNIVRDSNGDIIRNKDHKDVYQVVYNFYGYGAHDNNPLEGGVNYAFERDWFSPETAVIGGAKNISNNYISQGQNTLYKMKWDPDFVEERNERGKQYATHIMWPILQADRMFNMLGEAIFTSRANFEVPHYKEQPKASSKPPAPKPDLPPAEVENYYSSGTLGETTANVNFRKGPSTGYGIITTISDGSEVQLIGDNGNNWIKATFKGKEGWLHSDYVTITFEPVDVVNNYPEGTTGTVDRKVNFRKGPSRQYESYGFLSGGSSLNVIGDNDGNWVKVKHDGRIGWVHLGYVNLDNLYQVHASDGGNVNYRTEPNGNEAGTPVASLSSGTLVALSLDSNGDIVSKRASAGSTEYNWVRIKVNGNNYWMADDFLRKY